MRAAKKTTGGYLALNKYCCEHAPVQKQRRRRGGGTNYTTGRMENFAFGKRLNPKIGNGAG